MIGVGVLPVLALAVAARRTPADRRRNARCSRRSSAAIVAFGLYTAVKASYLSTTFAIRVEERNLIYLARSSSSSRRAGRSTDARCHPVPSPSAAAVGYLLWHDAVPQHTSTSTPTRPGSRSSSG